MTYIHQGTTLGDIVLTADGLEVDCIATVMRRPERGRITSHDIRFTMYNRTADHVAGMKPLIDAALHHGREVAAAYIAARTEGEGN